MKKLFTILGMAAVALAGHAESESLDFTLAFKVNEALTFGEKYVGRDIWQAFYFTPEMADLYAGAEVTAINVTTGENLKSGTNSITRVTAYLMENLGDNAFRTQSGKIGTEAYTQYPVILDDPYTIEAGHGFYVAYKCNPVSSSDYYLPVDGVPRSQGGGCFIGLAQKDEISWADYSSDFGNLCMGIAIRSDNLPRNGASVFDVTYPDVVYRGEEFSMDVAITGTTCNPIESVELEYTIAGDDPVRVNCDLDSPLDFGSYTTLKINGMKTDQIGAYMDLEVKLTKVNGEPNISTEASRTFPLTCLLGEDMGYLRRFVVEEGTGTWCVWCPAGIVLMEYLKAEYPEQFIRVALHGNDQMTVPSIEAPLSMFEGFPLMIVDRKEMIQPSREAMSWFDRYYNEKASVPAIGEVAGIETAISSDRSSVKVNADVRFAVPVTNNGRYGIAYYITEDGVGPYLQANNYSGGENGPMGGWENEPDQVPTIYDDVARYYTGGPGGLNQLPSQIEADALNRCSQTLSLEYVNNEQFYVTVMIIDNVEGSVLNAAQVVVGVDNGVDSPADGSPVVKGSEGAIEITGAYSKAAVYDMQGVNLAIVEGEPVIPVAPGLYIVNVDGKSRKIIVK